MKIDKQTNKIKLFIWFWKTSFQYMSHKSKLWVLTHGWGACYRFMKLTFR